MISFFGKLRRQLLSESRLSKYLIYAAGEIILVMIGILLALQVNNWNESRKATIREVANLISLRSELETSLRELKADYKRILNFQRATENVYKYIQTKPKVVDSMYTDFYRSCQFSFFFPKMSSYETFKSYNLTQINSDTLRMMITDIFESGYKRISTKVNTRRNAANILFPYYKDNFKTQITKVGQGNEYGIYIGIPNDYEALINDPTYETLIIEALIGRQMETRDFRRTIEFLERGIKGIDDYLRTKEGQES